MSAFQCYFLFLFLCFSMEFLSVQFHLQRTGRGFLIHQIQSHAISDTSYHPIHSCIDFFLNTNYIAYLTPSLLTLEGESRNNTAALFRNLYRDSWCGIINPGFGDWVLNLVLGYVLLTGGLESACASTHETIVNGNFLLILKHSGVIFNHCAVSAPNPKNVLLSMLLSICRDASVMTILSRAEQSRLEALSFLIHLDARK